MTTKIASPYQKNNLISNLRSVLCYCSLLFLVHSVKQTVKIMRCLILVFAVCLYPIKRTDGLYGQLFSGGTEKRNVYFDVK